MKRFKRLLLVLIFFVLFSFFPISAQITAVIDAPHILETVWNGYQLYQSVLNSIKQIEYAYITTQTQLKSIQKLDMNDIRSFTDAVSLVDKQINFVRTTENRFKNISVSVGGKRVPLSQFYRLPGESVDMIVHDMTAEMSDWEKARAWSHYGLHPANYMYVRTWQNRLNEGAKQLAVIRDVIQENNQKTAEEVEAITGAAEESESSLAVLQSLTALMQILIGEQMEANRLNAMSAQYTHDKDMLSATPVEPRSTFSSDWIE
ncbi:MAG TPA: hypothetical protein GX005_09765 [Bacteroidales bacterium]|nr:hypothetical protein [Bacteroidales bacterium]